MRHPEWEQRLHAYLVSVRSVPHAYGKHDCLLFCAGVVEAVTGKDLGRKHRGKYNSPATAVRHLKKLGFSAPEEMLDSLFDGVPVGFAQRGDLVLTPEDTTGWKVPGACAAPVALCVGPEGLVSEPRSRWLKAWRV